MIPPGGRAYLLIGVGLLPVLLFSPWRQRPERPPERPGIAEAGRQSGSGPAAPGFQLNDGSFQAVDIFNFPHAYKAVFRRFGLRKV